jgi:hypothetical protein
MFVAGAVGSVRGRTTLFEGAAVSVAVVGSVGGVGVAPSPLHDCSTAGEIIAAPRTTERATSFMGERPS